MFGSPKSAEDEAKEIVLNLTPMIDILTCLLFFLLLGYKSQSLTLEGAKGIQLPPSDSDKGLVVSMPLTVTQREIKLMDSHVMFIQNGELAAKDLEGSKILPLYNRLVHLLRVRKMDVSKAFVLLMADKRLNTDLITKIMQTCGMAGLPNFHFGVARP